MTMNRRLRIGISISIWCLVSVIAGAQAPARQKPSSNTVSPDSRAMTALQNMSDYLKKLKTFRINSEVSKDEVVDSNMKIQKNASNEVSVRLPDRLFAHVAGDEQDLDFIY